MTKQISLLFFLALILVSKSIETECPQNNLKDLIQTGLIQFENTNTRQSCKQIDIKFVIPNGKLQVVAAVISLQGYKLTKGIDYSIKVSPKVNISKFSATLLSDHAANWTKVKASYLACSRSDILLGSFLTDSFQTLKCLEDQKTDKNAIQVSHVVAGWTNGFISAKPVVFISGIKAITLSISSLKVTSAQLNASGILNIQLQSSNGIELELVQLSYVLINSSFPYQYGVGLTVYEYVLPMFSQIANNSLATQKWGIYAGSLICDGTKCPKVCLIKEDCLKALGNEFNGRCIICEKGTAWNANATKCVTVCGQNQIWSGQACLCNSQSIKVNTSCVLCVPNSTPDKLQKQCVCNSGFLWNNWQFSCINFTCPANSQPQANQKGYTCVCKAGFYPSQNACKLVPICPLNSTFNIVSQICVCTIEGQFIFNNTCVSCGKNEQFDKVSQKCVCKPNSLLTTSGCVACPEFSSLSQDKVKCVCNDGYIFNQFTSTCLPFKCPLNSLPNITQSGVKCNCIIGYFVNGQNCEAIPKCPTGAIFDLTLKSCKCESKTAILINVQCLQCPLNSAWNGSLCICNAGFTIANGVCIVACGKNETLQNNVCVCNSRSILVNKVCLQCPLNSSPNKEKFSCLCDSGFKWDDTSKTCIKIVCPQNSILKIVNDTSSCVCNEGFTPQGSICARVVKCPLNSIWSQQKLTCVCSIQGEYLVNNQCRKCGVNQEWSEKDKIFFCKKGFNFINGECKTCEIGEYFDGVTCSCQFGFYRNGLKCQACHSSCGTCSGPSANQCLKCSDVTLTFKNGSCTKDTQCPKGLYQSGASCLPCSTYCSDCTSDCACNSCINGFQLQSITYANISASYCVEKCGDGKRFELECDDGNNKSGDGCSAECKIEQGWSCQGGSSTSASVCMSGNPDRTYLQLTGTVHLYGKIVQGVRLSYIPDALTANGCPQCYNLIWVRVIRSDIVPGVRVNYLPASKYQFLVELEFYGTFAIPSFTIAVQINPQYAKYFNIKDMAQIQIKTIDPALLARKDKQEQLTIGDISQNKSATVSKAVVNEIFKL